MNFFLQQAERLRAAGCRTFWFGPVALAEVARVSELLGVTFPDEFVAFLQALGGGGVEGAEINGVDPSGDVAGGGTIVAAARSLGQRFVLPGGLVVLRVDEDEWVECLDCAGDGGVIGFELGEEAEPEPEQLAAGFLEYFQRYVDDQIAIEKDS